MQTELKNQPLRIGITGGIGSGKTTICKLFETSGIPVYYADAAAKHLMVHNPDLVSQIKAHFGTEAYTQSGELNRAYLAGIVFHDEKKLKLLNSLVHPVVEKDAQAWHARQQDAPYTLKEAALIFESGSHRHLDRVIYVYAPLELRIKRVMERDHVSRDEVLARVRNQWPEEDKIALSDHVIINDNTLSVIQQVHKLHRRLCSMTKNNV